MLNTLRTIELANVSQLFTSTWKHNHTQWRLNIIQSFMYEAIVKYVVQGLECVKQGLNPVFVIFHIFLKMINGVPFPDRSMYYVSQF